MRSAKNARRRSGKKSKRQRAPNAIAIAQRDFARELGLDYEALKDHEKGEVFERFAAFHVLRRFHEQELSPLALGPLVIGGTHDNQLDCIALMIDGRIVDAEEDADAALEAVTGSASVAFVVIQATRANRFDRDKMSAFVNGASSYFADDADFIENADLRRKRALKDHLRARLVELEIPARINVYCYFATLGGWSQEENKEGELKRGRRVLGLLDWIDEVEFEAVDRSRILDMMATSLPMADAPEPGIDPVEVEDYDAVLPRAGLIALPAIVGVEGGYFGHVPVNAFLSLLEREDGQGLREAVFTQNVRGYQGDGGVNQRIRETLESPDRAQFPLRNNGVTVVADALEEENGDVRLSNFQIVNGLQTSTVLYRMRDELRDASDVHVPVKLVAATDALVRRAIIDATNRQTPITGAALFAASEKSLELERYFAERAATGGPPLLLERRPGQLSRAQPLAARVTLEEVLRAFYAVFHENSQAAEKGFAALAGEMDDGLLGPSLTSEPYYVAARLLQFVRDLARLREEPRLEQIEYHAALGLRTLLAPAKPPIGDAVAMRAMCERIERQMAIAGRAEELGGLVMSITQSPRDRMRGRVPGVPYLKKTRDDVVKRARAAALPAP